MDHLAERTLRFALEESRPVIICYMGKTGFSQRRAYVRKITNEKVTVYDTQKRAPRALLAEGILSVVLAGE